MAATNDDSADPLTSDNQLPLEDSVSPMVTQLFDIDPATDVDPVKLVNISDGVVVGTPRPRYNYRSKKFWLHDVGAFLLVGLYFLVCSIISVHAQVQTTIRSNQMPAGFTLPDWGWSHISRTTAVNADWFMNPVIYLNTTIFLLVAGLSPALMFMRRVLFVWSSAILVRAITIQVTQMPDPQGTCLPKVDWDLLYNSGPIMRFIHRGITKKLRTCGDMIFSGHTTMGTTTLIMSASCHFWLGREAYRCRRAAKNAERKATGGGRVHRRGLLRRAQDGDIPHLPIWSYVPRWLPMLATSICVVFWVCFLWSIVASRIHFTVDIVVAMLVASLSALMWGTMVRALCTRFPPVWVFSDTPEARAAAVTAARNAGPHLHGAVRRAAISGICSQPPKQGAPWTARTRYFLEARFMPTIARIVIFILYGGAPPPPCVRGLGPWPGRLLNPWADRTGDIEFIVDETITWVEATSKKELQTL